MSDTNTDDHYKKKHHHHHHHRNRHHKSKHKESGVQSQIDASLVPEATPIVSVAERVQSIESGGGRDVGNVEEPKFTSSATPLTLDENNILADPAVSFSDNSRSFKIKSSTDGPFQPTSPLPKPPQNEVNNIDGDNERDALNFVKHPIRETSKVATKIVSKLVEMQTEMTFQSISNKSTWSDAHISDNINEGKDSNQSPSKSSSSISMSSLVGYLLLAVCTIIKEVSVLFLGKSTVTFLEENMAPPPTVDAGCGVWMGWLVGSLIGIGAIILAKCMELFVYVMMTPLRVSRAAYVSTIKLIVRMLKNTPGGVTVLEAFTGFISAEPAAAASE